MSNPEFEYTKYPGSPASYVPVKFDDLDLKPPAWMEHPITNTTKPVTQLDRTQPPASLPIWTPPKLDVSAVEPSKWTGMGTALIHDVGRLASAWVMGMNTWADFSLTHLLPMFTGALGIVGLVANIVRFTGGKPQKQRAAAQWTYFSIPWIGHEAFLKYIEQRGIKIDNVHRVETRCEFGVINYHLGVFERAVKEKKFKDYRRINYVKG